MEYYVAESYKGYKLIGEPFEKSGKLYTLAETKCDKCGGTGIIASRVENGHIVPIPVANGVCFKCEGSKVIRKEIRLYNEKEMAQNQRAAARRKEKKAEEQVKKEKELLEKSEENKIKWMQMNGFNADGITYAVYGENTYAIKDELKEIGCKYSPVFGWHNPEKIDNLPEDYQMVEFRFDDFYEWSAKNNTAYLYENAKVKVEKRYAELTGASKSEYMGEETDRLRNITVIYSSSRGFMGAYGYTFIHTFYSGDNCLVWFTTKELNYEKGQVLDLTGTVKKHEEFRGVKTTQLSRCIIKEVQ